MNKLGTLIAALAIPLMAGCSSGSTNNTSPSSGSTADSLPLGDGMISTSPTTGYVMSCQQSFASASSTTTPPWIQGTVWYPSEKVAVEGSVSWPSHSASITTSGTTRTITSNNLPDYSTGTFPIASSDPAYQYDTNPNSIQAQTVSLTMPTDPTEAANATCVPMGMIGFSTDGVAIYNALDDNGRDAVAHEVQDSCQGHPESNGQYHVHGPSSCMPNEMTSGLVGYALDGFGIYGEKDATTGATLTNSDLDACHGTTSAVAWDGQMVTMYHYVLTDEYPYTIGCFRGIPVSSDLTIAQQNQIKNFNT